MESILVIDDDWELCELLAEYLKPEGFEVVAAHKGEKGMELLWKKPFNIVVLDVMLPGGLNGFEILKQIRTKTDIPVIMLTARGDDVDKIVGLEMGADDYLPKPFNARELIARIRAVLRRSRSLNQDTAPGAPARKYRIGDVEMDMNARVASKSGEPVRLTNVEFQILEILMRNFGQVVSRDDMAKEVLNRDLSVNDRSIDVHVSNLRRKLGPEPGGVERIKAVRGSGYVYVCSFSSGIGETPERNPGATGGEDTHAAV
jgi:two-component system response regulator CpxR